MFDPRKLDQPVDLGFVQAFEQPVFRKQLLLIVARRHAIFLAGEAVARYHNRPSAIHSRVNGASFPCTAPSPRRRNELVGGVLSQHFPVTGRTQFLLRRSGAQLDERSLGTSGK